MEASRNSAQLKVGFPVPARANPDKNPEENVLTVRDIKPGGTSIVVTAGPCAVENREQLLETATRNTPDPGKIAPIIDR